MSDTPRPGPVADAHQQVSTHAGYAYGTIGADLLVFTDRGPVYHLADHVAPPEPDPGSLRAQPSRMLDARLRVVDLVGRDEDLEQLAEWRDSPEGVAARWISGPGGSGKSRLAAEFCLVSHAAGWKTVHVTHGGGELLPPQGSVDLRLEGSTGVLLVVDYADRWSLSHLTWLMSNTLLHRPQPARVLLLGRSASAWAPLSAALENHRVRLDLMPLAGDPTAVTREEMFAVARDCFAARYELAEPADIRSPADLRAPEFDLVLAVHMAALVAVDAAATGNRTPENLAGLSAYLLDRELRHWTILYENRLEGLAFHTPPEVMARAVFVASLAGAGERGQARALLERFEFEVHPDRLLDDHARCYPPAAPATALQPLYPDRLAEDFVALSLAGHNCEAYRPDPMAGAIVEALIARKSDGSVPATAARTLTVLAAGAMRWPHVGASLDALIGRDPGLALAGGGATLAAVAAVPALTLATMAAIDQALPQKRDLNLDHGAAVLTRRLAELTLPAAGSAERYASILGAAASRLANAGHRSEAVSAYLQAIPAWRHLAWTDPSAFGPELARALHRMASYLAAAGQVGQAASVFKESLHRLQALVATDREQLQLDLAMVMGDYASLLARCGAPLEALRLTKEATDHVRAAAQAGVAEADYHLAIVLSTLGNRLDEAGHPDEALAISAEAVDRFRAMPDVPEELASALTGLSARLNDLDRHAEAAMAAEEALTLLRGLARANSRAFEPALAKVLVQASIAQATLGEDAGALAGLREAAEIQERLVQEEPGVHDADLALTMRNLAHVLSSTEAIEAERRSIELYRNVVSDNRGGVSLRLAYGLLGLATRLNDSAHHDEKRAALDEATSLLSELAKDDAEGAERALAHALTFTAQMHRMSDNDDRAVAAATEAVELYRRLPDGGADDPLHAWCLVEIVGHAQDVENLSRAEQAVQIYRETRGTAGPERSGITDMVLALFLLGDELVNADRLNDAVAVTEEVVDVCRRFAQDDDQIRWILGAALQRLGSLLPHVGRGEDAATASAEAIELARLPGGSDGSNPRLLSIAASAYSAVGRHREAVDLARAAVERHQEAHPEDDEESAVLLVTLGRVLAAAGRSAEAVDAGRAAVIRRRRLPAADLRRWGSGVLDALEFLQSAQDSSGAVSERRETVREMTEVCRPLALLYPAEFEPRQAELLVLLGWLLAAENRRPEAVPLAREAVAILFRLTREDAETFEPQLASALTNLGSYLNDADDDRASLEVAESTVAVYRRLVARDPKHEKELATALNNLGAYLAANEQVAEALAHIRQAITLLRAHASEESSGDKAALATYSLNLSRQLERAGDAEGAYAALLDSLEHYRAAVAIESDLYLPMLLGILDETTTAACNLSRWTEALRHSEERLQLRRRATSPSQALAFALMMHAGIYESAGQTIDGVPYAEDALRVLHQLNCGDAEGVASMLETTLQFLAQHSMEVADWHGALPLIQQLADLRRQRLEPASGESLRLFITTLRWLCDVLDELGDEPAAAAVAWEQYAAYEALEQLEPATADQRAAAAYFLGLRMKQAGRTKEALSLFDSATGPLRRLPHEDGDKPLLETLRMIDSCLLELRWYAEAHTATQETVAIYRRLAERSPGENLFELADSLVNHGFRLSYVEQFGDAVEAVNEGIRILTELHERRPAVIAPHLARALYSSAWILNLAGQDPARARTDAAASRHLLLSLDQEELTGYRGFLRALEDLQQDLRQPRSTGSIPHQSLRTG